MPPRKRFGQDEFTEHFMQDGQRVLVGAVNQTILDKI